MAGLLDKYVGSQSGVNLVNNSIQRQQTPQPQTQPQNGQPPQVDQGGNPAPAGSQGYDPLGRPYFGPGIVGTFKKYYYQLMGSPTSGVGLDNWNAIVDDFKKAETQTGQEWKDTNFDILKRSASGLFGQDIGKLEEKDTAAFDSVNQKLKDRQKQLEEEIKASGGSVNPQSIQSAIQNDELYRNILRERNNLVGTNVQKASTVDIGGQSFSLLTPLVRATQVGLTALMDIIQEPALKVEQAIGAAQKAQDVTEGTIDTRSALVDTLLRMIPPVAAYNAAKFVFSPTSPQEKAEALKSGWDSGRILYTQMYDQSVQAEFERRAEAGEDPQLLAIELANPWAEMAGQLILDPLNVVGYFSKAAKATDITNDMADQVKMASGLADNPEFVKGIESLANVASEGEAVRAGENVINSVINYFHGAESVTDVIPPTKYTSLALNSSGNQMKAIRTMGNTFTWIVASLSKDGKMDDVTDAITALVKLSSPNADEVQDGFSALMHFPSPMTYFNESSLQTSKMIRDFLTDADGAMDVQKLINKVKKTENWEAYGAKLKDLMNNAAKYEYPSVIEMKEAAENAKKAVAIGNKVPARTEQLAEQYKLLQKSHPGMIKLAELDNFLKTNIKNPVNKVLGTFYFSLNPGFAARNWFQNNLVNLVDAGPKAWFRDGQYMSDKFIGEELGRWFENGLLPPSITDYRSISDEFSAPKVLAGALSDKIEQSASKRVFYKFFRDTVDKMIQPGRALPTMEQFKVMGFTEGQANRFTSLVKENYGSVNKAVKQFTKEYAEGGPDVWRMVDTLISPKAFDGLKENGMMDEIMNFVKREDVGPNEIEEFMDGLAREQRTRASAIVDDPVGMSQGNNYTVERADLFAGSQAYTDTKTEQYLDQLFERSTQTRDKYVEALVEIRNKTGDPELSNFLDSLMKREPDEIIRKKVAGINKNTRAVLEKAKTGKYNLMDLWKQLGSPVEFTGNTYKDFASAAWNYTLQDKIPTMWNSHFGAIFAESEKYATKYGVSELLQQAKDMNNEAQQWRTFAYRDIKANEAMLPPSAEQLARTTGTDAASQAANRAETAKVNAEAIKQYQKTYGKSWAVGKVEDNVKKIATDIFANDADTFANMSYKNMELLKTTKPDSQQAKLIDRYISEVEKHVRGFSDEELLKLTTPTGGNNRFDTVTSVAQKELQARGLMALEDGAKVSPEVLKRVTDTEAQIAKNVFGDSADIFSNASITTGKAADAEKMAEYERQLSEAIKSFSDEELQAAASTSVIKEATMTPLQYVASQELKKRKGVTGLAETQRIPPPYLQGSTPTLSRAHAENAAGTLDALNQLKRQMLENFGVKAFDEVSPNLTPNLLKIAKDAGDKIAEGRLIAQKVGEYWRDFALLPYGETTNLDHALSYIYPYQFWYSRSYSNWFKRLASDPQIVAAYAKQKDLMAQLHKDSPDWFKQNITLPDFLGVNNGNPIFMNLEATLWPLYGLTGVDFNDPAKRQDWMSATIDDMGKFGPSMWSPINLAIAAGYSLQGENEAAQGWAGRVIPQTATIKAILAQAGMTPIELDPAVMMFSGSEDGNPFHSLDKYERKRVGYAIAEMMTQGVITEEEAIEASYTQQGPIWEQAVLAATQKRAPGQIASAFLGVGFKARTEADVQLDQFYSEYFKMMELKKNGYISDEDYKQQFNNLREQYPFMSTVLLSKRAGEERDAAYAYDIISRIPPGMSSEIFGILGIDPETTQKFYESGGDFEGWNKQEKDRFMTAMVDAGAILAIPSNASRREWTAAKLAYKDMQDGLKAEFGENILDQINKMYELSGNEREAYINQFPQVEAAMQAQTAYIANTPILSTYYGGLDIVSRYYSNQMYDQLDKEFGEDISDKVDYYYYLKDFVSEQEAKSFAKQEGLKAYFDRKTQLQQPTNIAIANAVSNIPDGPGVLTYSEPQNPTQQKIRDFVAGPPPEQKIAESVWQQISPSQQNLIEQYYQGEELPYSVEKRLDYLGRDYGMSAQEILRLLGAEVTQ